MVGRVRYRASWQQSLPLGLVLGAAVLMQLSNPLLWAHQRPGLPGRPISHGSWPWCCRSSSRSNYGCSLVVMPDP